jgi:predicted MFS family arabinose efflux permease
MDVMDESADLPFVRDRIAVLGYATIAAFAYCLYALGPMLTLLRSEFGISYTLMSAHSSLWAIGTLLAGLCFARLARIVGRPRVFWVASAGTATGAAMFAVGHNLAVTLAASALLGTAGAMVQTCTFAILSDHYGDRRDRALVEANIGASAAAVLAPLLLGWLANGPLGWRAMMFVPVLVIFLLGLCFRRDELPHSATSRTAAMSGGQMSLRVWLLCVLVGLVVGVEFCLVFYGAQLLHTMTGMDTVTAATAMALFFAAELVGRVVGSGLTRRPRRSRDLLTYALLVSLAGMLPLWLSHTPAVSLIGLALAGLGIANLFPLALTLAVTASDGLTDKAAARSQLFVGLAITLGPLILSVLSDQWGVQRGFITAVVLAAAALVLLFAVGEGAARGGRERNAGAERLR